MVYFKDYEMECKCGCGQLYTNKELLERLNRARELADIPFIISSWNRCSKHNHKCGGSSTSGHLRGEAVDIIYKNSVELFSIQKSLFDAGFTRMGINHTSKFIHVDVTPEKLQGVVFTY